MSRKVFLAYPLTKAEDLPRFEPFLARLRHEFETSGWIVFPSDEGQKRMAAATERRSRGAVLASNVAAVTTSDLLVVLVSPAREPSSIWVELGMALAQRRPIIIVGDVVDRLPFLGRLAVASEIGEFRGSHIRAAVPPDLSQESSVVAQVIGAAQQYTEQPGSGAGGFRFAP